MKKEIVTKKVLKIVKNELNPEKEVFPESNIYDDLGADSLDAVEIVMSIESEFEIIVKDEAIEKLRVVQDFIDYVLSSLNK